MMLQRDVGDIYQTIEELERYAEHTSSTILYTTLQAGGITSTAADHAASHIGKAGELLLLIKSLPYHANRNHQFSYLPATMAEKHGLLLKQGERSDIRTDSHEKLSEAVFDMASTPFVESSSLGGKVPKEGRSILMPAVASQAVLDSLSRVGCDVFDPMLNRGILGVNLLFFQLNLKWHSRRGVYE